MPGPPVALDRAGELRLADALGDEPETVISVHLLRRGLARAVVLGRAERLRAAVVQSRLRPEEPTGFGDDPDALWAVLRDLPGWTAVNVPAAVGAPLAGAIAAATGVPCRLGPELYHVLDRPVASGSDPVVATAVRRLAAADRPLLDASAAPLGMDGWRFGSAVALLAAGFAAGAVIDGELVSVAFASARTDHHAEIGIVTREEWRGRGLATIAAGLVCTDVQAAGLRPVWSTAEENGPSRRVAAKLGFVESGRRVYVNPEADPNGAA